MTPTAAIVQTAVIVVKLRSVPTRLSASDECKTPIAASANTNTAATISGIGTPSSGCTGGSTWDRTNPVICAFAATIGRSNADAMRTFVSATRDLSVEPTALDKSGMGGTP